MKKAFCQDFSLLVSSRGGEANGREKPLASQVYFGAETNPSAFSTLGLIDNI